MPRPTADAGEVVYLLHFSAPYRHARHYLGTTRDLDVRLWRGGRRVERALKRCGGAVRFCPVCTPGTTWGALRITRRRGHGPRRSSYRSPF